MEATVARPHLRQETAHLRPKLPPDGPTTAYMFVRYVTHILDDLSMQGLRVWTDADNRWYWRWEGTDLVAERGFWVLGETVLDAIATRYAEVFISPVELAVGVVAE